MAGAPLRSRKITWAGAVQRRALLAQAGILLDGDLGLAGEQAGVNDVLDAAAAAWTARRVSQGAARCLPSPPEVFSDGIPAAILDLSRYRSVALLGAAAPMLPQPG